MLAAQGIISGADNAEIQRGLDQVKAEIDAGEFEFKTELEDIHMNVEARLAEIIGEPAGRLPDPTIQTTSLEPRMADSVATRQRWILVLLLFLLRKEAAATNSPVTRRCVSAAAAPVPRSLPAGGTLRADSRARAARSRSSPRRA